MSQVSPDLLRELFRYEPETGKLFWLPREPKPGQDRAKVASWNTKHAGREAFTADCGMGYKQGAVNGKNYRAHRVVWAITFGRWPDAMIDHINGDRADNRISNLREVTAAQNTFNSAVRRHNKLGVKGVKQWGRRFAATIRIAGVIHRLGVFDTPEDAASAYAEASRRLHGEFGRVA